MRIMKSVVSRRLRDHGKFASLLSGRLAWGKASPLHPCAVDAEEGHLPSCCLRGPGFSSDTKSMHIPKYPQPQEYQGRAGFFVSAVSQGLPATITDPTLIAKHVLEARPGPRHNLSPHYMGSCQNYDPFLGPNYSTARTI